MDTKEKLDATLAQVSDAIKNNGMCVGQVEIRFLVYLPPNNTQQKDESRVLSTINCDEEFRDAKDKWIEDFEREYIKTLLEKHEWDITLAAKQAGINRVYFRKLMKKYNIPS